MPRNYVPVGNKRRPYNSCSTENLEKAAKAITEGMTFRVAEDKFKVKRSTLSDFIRKGGNKPVGRPTLLTPQEEKMICDLCDTVADWGFPIGQTECR